MRALADLNALFDVPRDQWHLRQCPVCGGALSVVHSHTYVVQRQDWIKIGATSNVTRRINELRRPAWTKHLLSPDDMDWHRPLTTLAVLEGDTEHKLHEQFASSHALDNEERWGIWGGVSERDRRKLARQRKAVA